MCSNLLRDGTNRLLRTQNVSMERTRSLTREEIVRRGEKKSRVEWIEAGLRLRPQVNGTRRSEVLGDKLTCT